MNWDVILNSSRILENFLINRELDEFLSSKEKIDEMLSERNLSDQSNNS